MFYITRETVINRMIDQGEISPKSIEAQKEWLQKASEEQFEECLCLCTNTTLNQALVAIAEEFQRYNLL